MSAPYLIQKVEELELAPSTETRSRGASYFNINYALLLLATRKNTCNMHPTYHDVCSHHQLGEISLLMKLLHLSGLLLTVKSTSVPNYPNFSVDSCRLREEQYSTQMQVVSVTLGEMFSQPDENLS